MRRRFVFFIAIALFCLVTLVGIGTARAAENPVASAASATSVQQAPTGDGESSASNSPQGIAGESATRSAIQQAAEAQLDTLPTQDIDAYWKDLQDEYGGYLPDLSGGNLVRAILGNGGPSFSSIIHGLTAYFFHELFDDAALLGTILILSVIAAVLKSMQGAFEQQSVSQIADLFIFFALLALVTHSFIETLGAARHAIETMNHFMLATVPLTVTLLAASGSIASAAFFQPMLLFTVHFVSNVVFYVVFPLIFFSAVLDLTSTLSVRYQLTRLAGLFRSVGIGVLGLALAGFIGVTTIQGAGKGIVDGVVLRTMKFGVSTFVPVVGKAISDAAETVLSASLLVKNAVGVAGLVVICLIAVFPAIKILAVSLMYGGSAAMMQPLGETPMVACLGTLGKTLVLVFACVAAVALMFFFSLCILLASANLAVMTA